ncbi:MAG: tRNA (guanosine(46)-N7)-methyltransferase TrmB [Myxococcales bacterium]|nr:tRNA (guanosine(46)-N7)-methyltransferase TrmB [Myxococcales bacterium]
MKLKSKTARRLRHHTNPLTFRETDLVIPDWEEHLGGPPEEADIGIGLGDFLAEYATLNPTTRLVGMEVRSAFCAEARLRLHQQGLHHALVVHVDATRYLNQVLPPACLRRVFISFPDPWFKKRHAKRRLVNHSFVEQLHQVMAPGSELFVQTDQEHLAKEIPARLEASGLFRNRLGPGVETPGPITEARTERERFYLKRNWRIWRYLFDHVAEPLTAGE